MSIKAIRVAVIEAIDLDAEGVSVLTGGKNVFKFEDGFVPGALGPIADAEDLEGTSDATRAVGAAHEPEALITLAKDNVVKVTLRVWLEGQSASCISENTDVKALSLTLGFQ